jgi:hypothetical protein
VPSLATQRQNYVVWFNSRPKYFHPSETELDRMWGALEEGDLVHFDFAHSITVQKPNGLLISVDRRGRIAEPSPYSPAVREQKRT